MLSILADRQSSKLIIHDWWRHIVSTGPAHHMSIKPSLRRHYLQLSSMSHWRWPLLTLRTVTSSAVTSRGSVVAVSVDNKRSYYFSPSSYIYLETETNAGITTGKVNFAVDFSGGNYCVSFSFESHCKQHCGDIAMLGTLTLPPPHTHTDRPTDLQTVFSVFWIVHSVIVHFH